MSCSRCIRGQGARGEKNNTDRIIRLHASGSKSNRRRQRGCKSEIERKNGRDRGVVGETRYFTLSVTILSATLAPRGDLGDLPNGEEEEEEEEGGKADIRHPFALSRANPRGATSSEIRSKPIQTLLGRREKS